MFISAIRRGDIHKFISILKKLLNLLVQPSPNLPINDMLDDMTIKAVRQFKLQWRGRVSILQYDANHLEEITVGLWAMIGKALGQDALGKDILLKELRETKDYEVRSLLLGMDFVGASVPFYTSAMEACDAKIASILGGKNAVAAANGFEPDSIAIVEYNGMFGGRYQYYRGTFNDGKSDIWHLSGYIMHLYGSTDGTRFGVDGKTYTDIYVPDEFEMKNGTALTQKPTPEQNVVHFYYKKLGNVENATLLLMHVKDFKPTKEGNRWRIGQIGGTGGEILNTIHPYLHSHFALLRGDVGLGVKVSKGGD